VFFDSIDIMSKHKPIHFENLPLSTKLKERLKNFVSEHPNTTSITKVVLVLAALGGILTIGVMAPGLLKVLGKFKANKNRSKREKYNKLWRSFNRLKKERQFVCIGEKDGELLYKFTKNGEIKFRKFILDTLKIIPPRKWDGDWRIIIFDIPEKYRHARWALRKKLMDLGCYQIQKSVWTHPFPCDEEIEFLKDFFEIKPYVYILLTKNMPHGRALYHFREILKTAI